MNRIVFTCFCLSLIVGQAAQASMPAIVEVTGASGVKAWLVEDHKLPLVSVRIAFMGGVETDPADKQGLATLSTGLLLQGSGPYDDQAFQERLAARSIEMDISASRDYIQGKVKTLAREKKEAFRLLALALTKPRFDQEPFERLKQQQLSAIKIQQGRPDWQGRYALYRYIFGEHPYSFRSLGTAKSLEQITRDDVRRFAQQRLSKDHLFVAVVGAISQSELKQLLDSTFGSLPEDIENTDISSVVWPQEPRSIQVLREGAQTQIKFALPGPDRLDPDWYAAEIANYILGGGGFISRLMKAVRAQEGLTYGISVGVAPMEKASVISGAVATDNAKAGKAWSLVQDVWRNFFKQGATQEEVDAARNYLMGSLPLSLTSTDAIAEALLTMQTERLGRDYLEKRNSKLEAVTLDDVNRVIQKWFDPDRISLSAVGKPEGLKIDQMQEMIME